MTQDRNNEIREEARWGDAPPSELGDVEDAVAEEVGGSLTELAPPDEGRSEAASDDAKATNRS